MASIQRSNSAEPIIFGYTALSLGEATHKEPSVDSLFNDTSAGVLIDVFYPVGGVATPFAASAVRLLWDEDALYLLFSCENPFPNTALQPRDDKMALYINLNNEKDDYFEFSVTMRDITTANHFQQGDKIEALAIPRADSQCADEHWLGKVTVPWHAIGGPPPAHFGLLIVRHRQQNDPLQGAELSSPVALDFANPTRPGMYLETFFGPTASLLRGSADFLTALPSGNLHWQRPARVVMPNEEECQALHHMQLTATSPTTIENLAERIHYLQRCQDMLALEVCIFSAQGGVWPIPMQFMPWDARNALNLSLARADIDEACRITDILLQQFAAIIRYWYVDGSPGNILRNEWKVLESISAIHAGNDAVRLEGFAGGIAMPLTLTCPATGGVRIRAEHSGYYQSDNIAFDKIETTNDGMRIFSNNIVTTIQTGNDWSITVQDALTDVITWRMRKEDLTFFLCNNEITGVDLSGTLQTDEAIFGFGERFDHVNQRNNIINLRVFDCNDPLILGMFFNGGYKISPLMHSSCGYSIYFNTSFLLRADLGKQQTNCYRYTTHGPIFDLYLWNHPPLKVLEQFSVLTGKPLLPPKWVFEPWMGGTPYTL